MIIGITGGKGGTGKSTVATSLANLLSRDHKVLLADMDVNCPNDHLLLDIKREHKQTVYQRIPEWDYKKCIKCGQCARACMSKAIVSIKGRYPIFIPAQCNGCGACKIVCRTNAISWSKKEIGNIYNGRKSNIDFISGELKINEPVSEFVVDAVKSHIKKEEYDYVIVDTAAGTHCDVISALQICDLAYIITESTPLGAHDAELIILLLQKLSIPYDVILNKHYGNNHLLKKMLKRFDKEIYAEIPYNKRIINQYSKGIPISDKSIGRIFELTVSRQNG